MSNTRPTKGPRLEVLAAAYFQSHGYFVRRGVHLSVAAGTKEATDIDILAIRYTLPLSEERLVADCKERKRPKPFERILWARGLATFAGADRCIVVTLTAPWQAREFGSQGSVQLLDRHQIEEHLAAQKDYIPFASADPAVSDIISSLISSSPGDEPRAVIKREALRARQLLVLGSPVTNLNRIIATLSSIGALLPNLKGDAASLARITLFDTAPIAAVMLLRFAAESKWTPEKDWASNLSKRLTYGDVSPRKAQELTRLAFDKDYASGIPVPPYVDEVTQLASYLIHHPAIAAHIPYGLDLLLTGRLLGHVPPTHKSPVLGQSQDDVLKAAKRLLSVLSYAANLQPDVWESPPTAPVRVQGSQQQLPLPRE